MIYPSRWFSFLILSLGLAFSSSLACQGGTPIETNPQGMLYVLDSLNDSVYVFENAITIDGEQIPTRTIFGENTLISAPRAMAVDTLRDILYVADAEEDRILVFGGASAKDGDVTPSRTLLTDLNPRLMELDESNNRLYVFDSASQSVLVWDQASTRDEAAINDDGVADRIFDIPFNATSMVLDPIKDLLYLGDPDTGSIQIFAQASTALGLQTPIASIKKVDEDDLEEDFVDPNALAINEDNDILFAFDAFIPNISFFDDASTLDASEGDLTPPDRTLEGGSTELIDETVKLLFLENELYANLDDTRIGIWANANQGIDGNIAPNRIITVSLTAAAASTERNNSIIDLDPIRIIDFDVDLSR